MCVTLYRRADGDTNVSRPPPPPPATETVGNSGVALGRELVHIIMLLLFTPGITVERVQFDLWMRQLQQRSEQDGHGVAVSRAWRRVGCGVFACRC